MDSESGAVKMDDQAADQSLESVIMHIILVLFFIER